MPDKSRRVVIDKNYTRNSILNSRNLSVTDTSVTITLNGTHAVVTNKLENNGNIVLQDIETDNGAATPSLVQFKQTAQLIQTKQGANTNTGTGNIFINQSSAIKDANSVYRYTYWSSPVIATKGDTFYTVGSVMKDPSTTPTNIVDINFTDASYNGTPGTPVTLANYWIFTYLNGVDNDGFIQRKDDGKIPAGVGYLMKGSGNTNGQDYTFVGKPNNGDIVSTLPSSNTNPEVLVKIKENSNNIVGNPYPSSIDAVQFIYDNNEIIKNGSLYFWQHVGEASTTTVVEGHTQSGYRGGYATRNLSMGVNGSNLAGLNSSTGSPSNVYIYHTPGRYIPVGQGFLFTSKGFGATDKDLKFSNWQRVYQKETLTGLESGDYLDNNDATNNGDDSHFLGRGTTNAKRTSNNNLPILRLGFEHNNENNVNLHRQLGIAFKNGLSFDKDYGYDSPMYDSQLTEIYWKFPNDDNRYLIAGVQELSEDMEIPIDIVIGENKPVSFMIDGKRNIDYPVYLYDIVNLISYDLSSATEITLPVGTYTDRFFITFKEQSTVLDTDNEVIKDTTIFFDTNTNEIVIKSLNAIDIQKVELFNILGQKVANWKDITLENNETRLKVQKLATSVYIVNLKTDKGKISKKLIIE